MLLSDVVFERVITGPTIVCAPQGCAGSGMLHKSTVYQEKLFTVVAIVSLSQAMCVQHTAQVLRRQSYHKFFCSTFKFS